MKPIDKRKTLRPYHGEFAYQKNENSGDYYCYFNPMYKPTEEDVRSFRYLDKELVKDGANRLPEGNTEEVIRHLTELADLMVDPLAFEQRQIDNSRIPVGYTYWGQFVDHDITAGTDRSHQFTIAEDDFSPVAPDQVEKDIENLRTPFLDLDSVYGDKDGPFGAQFFLYEEDEDGQPTANLRIGTNDPASGGLPDPELGNQRDLPRNLAHRVFEDRAESIAVLGDLRNDENLIVAQFHLAFFEVSQRNGESAAGKSSRNERAGIV